MYDLETIHRLNDAAALREQFPKHDCAEEVLYNPEYESFGDSYVDRDEFQSVKDDRDWLADKLRLIVSDLRQTGTIHDEFAARELESEIAVRTRD